MGAVAGVSGAPSGVRLGTPFGVPIHLAASWPLFAVFAIVYFGPQIQHAVPELGAGAYVVAAAYVVLLALSVFAHEVAHAVAARASGARVGRIVLDLFGGHTVYEADRLTPGQSALVAVVGPLTNGVLAALGWVVVPVLPDGVPWLLGMAFVWSNAIVAIFNLIPGHPLDGGHLLDALVWRVTGRRDLGLLVSGWAGRLVALGVVAWFALRPLAAGVVPSLFVLGWAGLIAVMLWAGASQAVRHGRHLRAYARVTTRDVLAPVVLVTADTPLSHIPAGSRGAGAVDPIVLVGDADAPAESWLLCEPPADLDPREAASVPASAVAARPRPGWILDTPHLPDLADLVDHMHAASAAVVLVRTSDGVLGGVEASTVAAALRRHGLRP